MRRALLALVTGGAVLVAGAVAGGVATAQDATDRTGNWEGTTVFPGPEGTSVQGSITWRPADFNLDPQRFLVDLTLSAGETTRETCPEPYLGEADAPQAPYRVGGDAGVVATPAGDRTWEGSFSVPLSSDCNGRFEVTAVVQPEPGAGFTTASTSLTVARPAGRPATVSATLAEDGSVRLTWGEPNGGLPPDFAGYRVRRAGSDSALLDGSSARELTDHPGLAPGQEAVYEVMSLRDGPDGVVASAPVTAKVGVPAPEDPVVREPVGAGTPMPGGAPRVARPATGSRGPSLPALPRPTTVTTLDTGYAQTLPYDRARQTGAPDPALAGDESASLIFEDGPDGAGLLVPTAAALVLAVWAMHLAYLNRLAGRS